MHTFSCALQSVDVDGTTVTFAADLQDYGCCLLTIGDNVLTFDRNGLLVSITKLEPPAEEPAESAETSEVTQPQPEATEGGA